MDKSTLKLSSRLAVTILCILGLIELGLALWTVLDDRYKSLAYNLANVGYIDLWILRYLSLCLFASSIITLVMCLILIWGLCSTHAFLFIASTMIAIIAIGEITIAILTFASKYETRITLIEQLPKLVITYRQGSDERARRALDVLQSTFRCCGADGRLSFQNNVPLSCNMFSVGCLTRTIYFLDSCMDALAYVLLFFSLIKFFIVLFFYSFLCLYYRYRQARARNHPPYTTNDSSGWRRSSSFNSSSPETSPKKLRILPTMSDHDKEYIERRHDYKPSPTTKRMPNTSTEIVSSLLNNNDMTAYYDKQNLARKLSSISEKTEKTETDDSEPDLLRLKYYKPKRKGNMTNPNQKHNPPVLPVIKARRKIVRDEDVDSGVERSSSEKSFEEQGNQRQFCDTTDLISKSKQTNNSSSSPLSFSNVFVTSTSQSQIIDDEVRQPLTTRSSPLFNHFLPNDLTTPKPILKKSHQQSSPSRVPATYLNQKQFPSVHTKASSLLENIPQPNPRSSLKQYKQAESLM